MPHQGMGLLLLSESIDVVKSSALDATFVIRETLEFVILTVLILVFKIPEWSIHSHGHLLNMKTCVILYP